MTPKQDATHLKTSPLLRQTIEDFRQSLVDRWIDANEAEAREYLHAGVRVLNELVETLDDRIERALGDE